MIAETDWKEFIENVVWTLTLALPVVIAILARWGLANHKAVRILVKVNEITNGIAQKRATQAMAAKSPSAEKVIDKAIAKVQGRPPR